MLLKKDPTIENINCFWDQSSCHFTFQSRHMLDYDKQDSLLAVSLYEWTSEKKTTCTFLRLFFSKADQNSHVNPKRRIGSLRKEYGNYNVPSF